MAKVTPGDAPLSSALILAVLGDFPVLSIYKSVIRHRDIVSCVSAKLSISSDVKMNNREILLAAGGIFGFSARAAALSMTGF